jgi:PhnB protein
MVVADPAAAVSFLREVFDAHGDLHDGQPAEVVIGDSMIMVSGVGARAAFPAFLYIYVGDADLTFQRAIKAGATSLEDPVDTPYGDRRAMVRDPFGNVFQIAHRGLQRPQ